MFWSKAHILHRNICHVNCQKNHMNESNQGRKRFKNIIIRRTERRNDQNRPNCALCILLCSSFFLAPFDFCPPLLFLSLSCSCMIPPVFLLAKLILSHLLFPDVAIIRKVHFYWLASLCCLFAHVFAICSIRPRQKWIFAQNPNASPHIQQ